MDPKLANGLKTVKDLLKASELPDALDALTALDEAFQLNIGDELLVQSARFYENEAARDQVSIDDYRRFKTQVSVALTKLIRSVENPPKTGPAPVASGGQNQSFNPSAATTAGGAKPAQPVENQPVVDPPKLTVLYASDDAVHALSLEKMLKPMVRANQMAVHFQHKIAGDADLIATTNQAIGTSKKVAVLVTSDFFFYDENIEFVKLAKAKGLGIVPILVKSHPIETTELKGIRGLPSNGKSIVDSGGDPSAAWLDVTKGLQLVMGI